MLAVANQNTKKILQSLSALLAKLRKNKGETFGLPSFVILLISNTLYSDTDCC